MKNINQINDVERKLNEADEYAEKNSTRLEIDEVVMELKKVIENLK
ncbi:hypothetical protein [Mediannikoviicoccus vaginalis]|nr:hypothetical protein [Mediannikoviicoccus vaginalis]